MIIKHDEMKALLEEKKALFEKGIKITEKIEKLDAERNTLAMLSQKVKDKMMPIVERDIKAQLNEFDILDTIKLMDDGMVEIVVIDAVEEFKKNFKEANKVAQA